MQLEKDPAGSTGGVFDAARGKTLDQILDHDGLSIYHDANTVSKETLWLQLQRK